jgi:hypothetical protein
MEACGWSSSAANCNVTLEKVSHNCNVALKIIDSVEVSILALLR